MTPYPSTAPRTDHRYAFTVGFDLDLTLVDSRPGIRAAYAALAAATGTHIDLDLVISRLGPPLVEELRNWFPEEEVAEANALYLAGYPQHGIAPSPAMPGARESLAAIRELGGRAIVVTAKNPRNARLHLDHLGIDAEELIGDLWAEDKALALRAHGASVYVGDHIGDVLGARKAGALAVAVPTGPYGVAELSAAGADVVLPGGLTDFPDWLRGHRAGSTDRHQAERRRAD
ncbi:HAD family hydrolase [Streptomyces abikoensis]|uniref:HAD family hydrolase n=1 Tax=Streptomyces abikoensis TaxID=97398 RepID=UPI00167AEB8D|nr:HAD hydrolase-like protein [Streptomyces abikoensis]GGP61321.1 hydrolase [Streptomyces abikoensis]